MPGLTGVIGRRTLLVGTLAAGVASAHRAMGERSIPSGVGGLPIPPSRALAFRLMRNDAAIGTHTLDFDVSGDTLTVRIVVDVLFTLGPIPLVHYRHTNTEIWRGGRLSGLEAHTDRNGIQLFMSA